MIQEHDTTLIQNINAAVRAQDVLFILGDFSMASPSRAAAYRMAINCETIYFVHGNHDLPEYDPLFTAAWDQAFISVAGKEIFLNHYPMKSWNKSHKGSWHCYGHVHGGLLPEEHEMALDVGVDSHDYKPWSFAEIEEYMKNRLPKYEIWHTHQYLTSKDDGGMTYGPRKN